MYRFRFMWLFLFVLASIVLPVSALAQGPIEKTYCTYAVGFESVERMKLDLLNNAKRLAVNEFFGEFITASTAVENSVVTSDQLRASSVGFVRVSGDAEYYNGTSFAEVCVMIRAFVTQDDLKLVEPVRLNKRVCLARENMAAEKLAELVKEEAVLQTLHDYDRRLADKPRDQVLGLMQRIAYAESGFLPDTTTYCAEVEGDVTPIEVLAFFATEEPAALVAPASAPATVTPASSAGESAAVAAPLPVIPDLPPRPTDLVLQSNANLSGVIERDTLLTVDHGPYIVSDFLTIAEGVTLVIDPGVIVKLDENMLIGVSGTLRSEGTAENPVVFTSLKDDTVGGDTNGDRSSTQPVAGDWGQIYFAPTSQASFLIHTRVEYGGLHQDLGGYKGNRWYYFEPGAHDIVDYPGSIYLVGASPVIRDSEIRNGWHAAVNADVYSFPILANNTLTANGLNGLRIRDGKLDPNQLTTYRWTNTDVVYVIDKGHFVTVGNKATLELAHGVMLKMGANAILGVEGALRILGEPDTPVIVTSLKDDTVGGDTNGDRSGTQPAAGDWGQIYFADTSVDAESLIQHTRVEYGGLHQDLGGYKGNRWYYFKPGAHDVVDYPGSIYLVNASPTIRNTVIAHADVGLRVTGASGPMLQDIEYVSVAKQTTTE